MSQAVAVLPRVSGQAVLPRVSGVTPREVRWSSKEAAMKFESLIDPDTMMSEKLTATITGSNRGDGFVFVRYVLVSSSK